MAVQRTFWGLIADADDCLQEPPAATSVLFGQQGGLQGDTAERQAYWSHRQVVMKHLASLVVSICATCLCGYRRARLQQFFE